MKSIALTLMLCVGVTAQVWYPFSPNPSRLGQSVWLDDTAATPIDEPHRITIRDGHFATSSGERVRFLAATITGAACYPDTNSAKAMAQWIRRIGYNAVVLRLWDYTGTGGQYPLLWRFGTRRSTEPFDSSQFDRLLYLMAELRRNGLYIALTTDGFIPLPDDGVARTDSLQFPWNVRYVQYIDSTYRALHRSVLERLLTAHNPYTGLRVGDDPALALLLLPDNNSLFAWWRSSALKALLPSAHQQMLHAQWNAFLRSRYTSTVQLQQAWRSIPARALIASPTAASRMYLHSRGSLHLQMEHRQSSITAMPIKSAGNVPHVSASRRTLQGQMFGMSFSTRLVPRSNRTKSTSFDSGQKRQRQLENNPGEYSPQWLSVGESWPDSTSPTYSFVAAH